MNIEELINQAEELATRYHYGVEEDPWYNCPFHPEGTANKDKDQNKCDCGTEEHNQKVKELFGQIRSKIGLK